MATVAVSELLRRAKVTGESLVWREGFVDWIPLRTVTELRPLLDSIVGARSGVAIESPPMGGDSGATEVATADHLDQAWGVVSSARGSREDAVTESALVDDLELLGIKRRRAPSAAALGPWVAVAAAAVFGLTIGYVVFSKNATAVEGGTSERDVRGESCPLPQPVQMAIAGVNQRGPEETVPEEASPAESGRVAVRAADVPAKDRGGVASQERPAPLQAQSGGLADLRRLTGARTSGPSGVESSSSVRAAPGAPLEASDIQLAVGRYKSSVKRGCWEPASSTRAPGAPSSARVEVTVDIAPNGRVSSVASSGDPRGYRGLARCIEGRVRGWQFPASGGGTTTRIPFVFATQ